MTNLVIGALKDGFAAWEFAYDHPHLGVPTNVLSKRRYSVPNALLLQTFSWRRRLWSKWWGTADDWKAMGHSVLKGIDPAHVLLCGQWVEVFSGALIAPAEFCPSKRPRPFKSTAEDLARCRQFVKATKADIRIGWDISEYTDQKKCAWYIPPFPFRSFPSHTSGYFIYMPFASLRWPKPLFYLVAFHELIHFCEPQFEWYPPNDQQELSAEIGAGLLAETLHLEVFEDRANYRLFGPQWIEETGRDLGWFLKVALQAGRAVDHLLLMAGRLVEESHELWLTRRIADRSSSLVG